MTTYIAGVKVPGSIEEFRELTWQDRAILATRGNGTRFGMMLLSAMGKTPDAPPRCGRPCITSDGLLIGGYVAANGDSHMGAMLGDVADLETNIIGFPQHINMTPEQRKEFYALWRKWIATDYRSPPGLRLDDGRV